MYSWYCVFVENAYDRVLKEELRHEVWQVAELTSVICSDPRGVYDGDGQADRWSQGGVSVDWSVARSGGGEPGEVGVCSGEKRNESVCVTMKMEAGGVQIPGGQLSDTARERWRREWRQGGPAGDERVGFGDKVREAERVRTCPEGQCKYWTKRKATEEGHDVVRTCRDH